VLDGDPLETQPPQHPSQLSARAYCGQMVVHLSNCGALVSIVRPLCNTGWMRPIATVELRGLSVCLSVMTMSHAKMAEPTEMLWDVNLGGPKELCF